MKKIITIAMSLLMVFMVISFSACGNKKNEEDSSASKTFNYEVQSVEELDVETAKHQLIEKCKESPIISQEIAVLRKAEYTENGAIPPMYISQKGDDVSINKETSWTSGTITCEPGMASVRVQNEPEYSRILMKKTENLEPVEIILNGTEKADYFHSFKFWDKNMYIQKGSDLYVLDKENVELILIADDFSKHVVYNDNDGQYYYLNTKNQWINTAGEVIEEGVFGVDTNGASKYKTVLFV